MEINKKELKALIKECLEEMEHEKRLMRISLDPRAPRPPAPPEHPSMHDIMSGSGP